jgi:serine/threonine-protein kinase
MSDDLAVDRARRAGEIFDELVELAADERARRLKALVDGDPLLAREVEELLAADALASGLLSKPVIADRVTVAAEWNDSPAHPGPGAGDEIGPWRLERLLGAGGMGEVWQVARADGAFEQRAALKLLKRGLDSESLLRRFRAERQILARLRHPAIAHLYDGGIAADGRPYYVMEMVAGLPLLAAAEARSLSIDERVRLVLLVCDAVQAAHRALVVHRDLKPSNILVSAEGEVKLLDFGIAKLLDDRDEDQTRAWERVMTPLYAAPEQILGEPVTTATDVYALGVVLYELLTGRLPHRREELPLAKLVEEMFRETVERPSTAVLRVASPEAERPNLDEAERERRARSLRGDLDWILLKALAREPERRYASAAALADDLRSHLEGRVVAARPDSLGYRTGTFVRRHRLGVAAAASVGLALVGGAAVALWQAREARAQATIAEAESERAREEAERARREATRSDRIAQFLKTMILEANPAHRTGSETPTLLDVLRTGAARIDQDLAGEPELRARMGIFFGDLFFTLEENDEAKRLIEQAHRIAMSEPGVEPVTVVDTFGSLGSVRYRERELDAALALFEEALDRLAAGLAAGTIPASASVQLEATLHSLFGMVLKDRGRIAEAIAQAELAIAGFERSGDRPALAQNLTNLGVVQNDLGRYADAERNLRRALDLLIELWGEDDPRYFFVGGALGDVLLSRGRPDEAIPVWEKALAAARRGFEPSHSVVSTAMMSLAHAKLRAGRLAEAEGELLAAAAAARGNRDRNSELLAEQYLGDLFLLRSEPRRASRHYEASRSAAEAEFGADSHLTLDSAIHLAAARARAGEGEAALVELERLVARQRDLAPGPVDLVVALRCSGEALWLAGRREAGVARLREAVSVGESRGVGESLATGAARLDLGIALAESAEADERAEGRRLLATAVAFAETHGAGWTPDAKRARELLVRAE